MVIVVMIAAGVVVTVIVIDVADDEFVSASRERIGSGPLEGVGRFEEFGIEVGDAGEVEAADIEHAVEGDIAVGGAFDAGGGVHAADAVFERGEFGGGDEVGLVEDDDVGEGDLLLNFGRIVEVLHDMFGVNDGDDAVDAVGSLDLVVGEKGLGDGTGVGEAGGFDENAVESVLALHESTEHANEIAANAAADATVVHFEELFIALDDELVIDTDFAEFVFDDGEFLPVLLRENAIEQSGFAGAKKAGEHGNGNGFDDGHRNRRLRLEAARQGDLRNAPYAFLPRGGYLTVAGRRKILEEFFGFE